MERDRRRDREREREKERDIERERERLVRCVSGPLVDAEATPPLLLSGLFTQWRSFFCSAWGEVPLRPNAP